MRNTNILLFMRWSLQGLVLALIFATPMPAEATSTICSNPKRERVLASAVIRLPSDNIQALERRFAIAAPRIDMESWGTALNNRSGKVERQTLGLQSPRVSVSIEADWRPGQNAATLRLRRTCINDAIEPWRGYWWGLVSELETAGYTVTPAPTNVR